MKIGFIGCGNMAGAILLAAVRKNNEAAADFAVYDPAPAACKKAENAGIKVAGNLKELVSGSDILLLGVKPQVAKGVLDEIKEEIAGKALVSICAGLSAAKLKEMAGDVRILRVMPNTPALVGEGAMAVCSGTDMKEDEKAAALAVLEASGELTFVDEKLMDAVTGLSGSGPAFAAMFIEAMADAGVKCGLTRTAAQALAAKTVLGTAKLIIEENMHPAVLKDMVSSPAGTTIAGVAALEAHGFRGAVIDAVESAANRSAELGK